MSDVGGNTATASILEGSTGIQLPWSRINKVENRSSFPFKQNSDKIQAPEPLVE